MPALFVTTLMNAGWQIVSPAARHTFRKWRAFHFLRASLRRPGLLRMGEPGHQI